VVAPRLRLGEQRLQLLHLGQGLLGQFSQPVDANPSTLPFSMPRIYE
jgi:hypothetical protein